MPRAIYDGPRVETYGASGDAHFAKISAQNRDDQDTTLVRCQGFDRTGQLASLTIAISSFGLQIVSTFIRTDADSADVDDLFYVQTSAGGPVPVEQHAALVAHMEHALGVPPSDADLDNVSAARDAGFLSGGGYDESAQQRAALEQTHRSNEDSYSYDAGGDEISTGGFFSSDTAGASLFDPNAYASYGNVDGNVENDGASLEVPHGPEIPDAGFFENPPPAPEAPLEYESASAFDWNAPSTGTV